MNRTINMCVVSGKIGPQRRRSVSAEYNADQVDFMIENEHIDYKGTVYKQHMLCRVLGSKTRAIEELPDNTNIVLVGRIKYTDYKAYIQAWEAEF